MEQNKPKLYSSSIRSEQNLGGITSVWAHVLIRSDVCPNDHWYLRLLTVICEAIGSKRLTKMTRHKWLPSLSLNYQYALDFMNTDKIHIQNEIP